MVTVDERSSHLGLRTQITQAAIDFPYRKLDYRGISNMVARLKKKICLPISNGTHHGETTPNKVQNFIPQGFPPVQVMV